MTIRVTLDKILAERDMSLTELSERVGITIANLSILKTGKAKAVRFTTLEKICEVLACQPGDILAVTGVLGSAALGLAALEQQAHIPPRFVRAQTRPTPHLQAGCLLRAFAAHISVADISDGLLQDTKHVCGPGVGADIDSALLPTAPGFARWANMLNQDAVTLCLTGGEDFALLCAIRPNVFAAVQHAFDRRGWLLQRIGTLTRAPQIRAVHKGRILTVKTRGFDHFS